MHKIASGLVFFFLFPLCVFSQSNKVDVLIINGRILDGSGNSWFYGDVAILGDKIIAIGRLKHLTATRVIDADGKIVAPGFIDVHTHIEGDEIKAPDAPNFIYDGVTTVVTGNCGQSEVNIGKYLNFIDSLRLSVNVATLLGHGDVRQKVMGRVMRSPSTDEMKQMIALVEEGMKDGAIGLSTGLIYVPGTYAQTDEVIQLAGAAARYGGIYASHIRNEGDSVVQAVEEAIQIGRVNRMPVQVSHYKISGQNNWGRSRETIPLIIHAREEGLDVTIDQYPYTASSTSLTTLFPDELLEGGRDSVRARLKKPAIRKELTEYMLARLKKRGLHHFSYTVIANYPHDTTLNGLSIEEANRKLGRKHNVTEEAVTIMEMVMNGGATMIFHGMSEEDVVYIMKYPHNMIASDASIRVYREGRPHPRGYGTNARVLGKYVREEKVLSLEEAIRRMTSLPAQKFMIHDRGLIRENMKADLVIFSAEKVKDNSTFESPHQYSSGFTYVLVNGQVVLDKGRHTGIRSGQVLRGPGYKKN